MELTLNKKLEFIDEVAKNLSEKNKKYNIQLLLLTLMPSLMSCWAATSRAVSPSLMKPRFMQSLMLVSYRGS